MDGFSMSHEYETAANNVRQTLIGLAERCPAVVALADMGGLQVWQLTSHFLDHLPPGAWRNIVDGWDVDTMHETVAALILWAERQQRNVDIFDDENTEFFDDMG